MRFLMILVIAVAAGISFNACKSSGPKPFCDTVCLKDTLKFKGNHVLEPYVYISAKDCRADSIIWSYKGMGTNRKLGWVDLLQSPVKINKDYVSCYIKDTSYFWLQFNDCETGRSYQLKIPYNKTAKMSFKNGALNSFDPKFAIPENLIVNTDRGNIFVEDRETGKKAMMTFGVHIKDLDYDAIHQYIDSVNVTNTRVWVRVKIENEWKELQKNITLE